MIIRHYAFADGTQNVKLQISSNGDRQENSYDYNLNKIQEYNFASFEDWTYNVDRPRKFYNGEKLGYSSYNVSNSDGSLVNPVTISAKFENAVNFSGITILTNDLVKNAKIEYTDVTDKKITVYYTQSQKNFYENTVKNVKSVLITINSINARNHFLDIYGVCFGKVYEYDESKIKNPKIILQKSVSGRELPIDSFDFNLLEPHKDLMIDKNQKIEILNRTLVKTENGIKINEVVDYVFYVDSFEEKENFAIIRCLDCVSLLDDTFAGGYYKDKLISDIATEILQDTDFVCDFDTNTKNIKVTGYIPIVSKRDALIYIANATGLQIVKQPNLKFVKLLKSNNNFDDSNIFLNSYSCKNDLPSKSVELFAYEFETVLSETDDIEVIYKGNAKKGRNIIYFDKPIDAEENENNDAFELLTNGNLISSSTSPIWHTNYVEFEVSNDCEVTVRAAYFIQSKTISIIESIENAKYFNNYKEMVIDKFSLMRINNGVVDYKRRAKELLKYYSINKTAKAKVLWEKPQINSTIQLYGETYDISKITSNFSSAVEIEVQKVVE